MAELIVTLDDREPNAYQSQNDSKAAVMTGQNFALSYLLAAVRDPQDYDNYLLPADLAQFEFTVKGVIRLEMLADPRFRAYRRLFGAMFTRRKTLEVYSWRSRAALTAFANLDEAQAFLQADPVQRWPNAGTLQLPAQLLPGCQPPLLLFQIQDVVLPNKLRFSRIVHSYLKRGSRLLQLVAAADILAPV